MKILTIIFISRFIRIFDKHSNMRLFSFNMTEKMLIVKKPLPYLLIFKLIIFNFKIFDMEN